MGSSCSRRTEPNPNQLISADLSYSDITCADNRGAAVAGVLLQGETLHANHALVYGTLADGRAHEARLRPPYPYPCPHPYPSPYP